MWCICSVDHINTLKRMAVHDEEKMLLRNIQETYPVQNMIIFVNHDERHDEDGPL